MSEKDQMTIDERRKYLYKMWGRYRNATKTEKSQMLDDMVHVTGLHRKSILRILNGQLSRKKRSKERGPTYSSQVIAAAATISKALDHPCAERLKPSLVFMARHLMSHDQLRVDEEILRQLDRISISTLKRRLANVNKSKEKIAKRRFPKRKKDSLKTSFPMRKIPYDIPEPGHFEVDLVLHCDENNTGDYIHTIQVVDVATGWCELQAVFGRSYQVMQDGFACMLKNLPFPVVEIHPDNGSEFFNQHLLRFWKDTLPNLDISRSRPYHKNDNRFIEENNGSLVRAYIGHGRLDSLPQLTILRQIYQDLTCYHNFFQPVMKMVRKEYPNPDHCRRVFDQARPPLDRLAETGLFNDHLVDHLFNQRKQVDVLALRERIEHNIDKLWRKKSRKNDPPVNIYDTLRKEIDTPLVTLSSEPSISVQ